MSDSATTANDSSVQERLAASDLAREPVFLAIRLSSRGSADANRALAALGLKVRHYAVLALACSDLRSTQRELSQFLYLDPSQIVGLVDELEGRQLVQRRPDPRDRRSKVIVATASGRRFYAEARATVSTANEETLAALAPDDRDQLIRLLAAVAF